MRQLLTIGATAALLAACAMARSEPDCLAVVPYDRASQARALAELNALPADAELRRYAEDYGDLRARARAWCAR